MHMFNTSKTNYLEIKHLSKIIWSIQFAFWGLILLNSINIDVPIIKQLICFVYLTFLPGILILMYFKLDKLTGTQTFLLSIGLSLVSIMFVGFLLNFFGPLVGIQKPISFYPLSISLSIFTIFLSGLVYRNNGGMVKPLNFEFSYLKTPIFLLLLLIPFLVIIGIYLVNFYHNNIFLIFSLLIIGIIPILVGFKKLPVKLYPFAIFIIAISLLLHRSLLSMYVWGWDSQLELFLGNNVINAGLWNPEIPIFVNGMLSICIIGPVYAIVGDISLTWVFKIIYPFIFALVPLGLYLVFKEQTNNKIAFMACFFLMAVASFYGDMISVLRQDVAEFFLVLVMVVLFSMGKTGRPMVNSLFLIVFAISIAVSHYGLSYIYVFIFVFLWFVLKLRDRSKFDKVQTILSSTFIIFFMVFVISWYFYTSGGVGITIIVNLFNHITGSIYTDFLNPGATQGLMLATATTKSNLTNQFNRVITYLNQIFIILGFLAVYFNRISNKFDKNYLIISFISLLLLVAGIILPFFASALNMTRLYHISLIFLAPFMLIGMYYTLNFIIKKIRKNRIEKQDNNKINIKIVSIYLFIFFILQVGIVHELTIGYSGSPSISQDSIKKYGTDSEILTFYSAYLTDQDFYGTNWVSGHVPQNKRIYADITLIKFLYAYVDAINSKRFVQLGSADFIEKNSYIYLGYPNVILNLFRYKEIGGYKSESVYGMNEVNSTLQNISEIYSNGVSEVYMNPDHRVKWININNSTF